MFVDSPYYPTYREAHHIIVNLRLLINTNNSDPFWIAYEPALSKG
jgi:hypothetical protein